MGQVHCEAVSSVVGRADVLSTLCAIAAYLVLDSCAPAPWQVGASTSLYFYIAVLGRTHTFLNFGLQASFQMIELVNQA
jgi:hypothetical protein